MQAAGFESIDLSKEQGLWQFMDDVDNLEVPDDLKQELSRYHGALDFFSSINPSSKRFVLRWIKIAKTDITRLKRIKEIAQLASEHKKLPGS